MMKKRTASIRQLDKITRHLKKVGGEDDLDEFLREYNYFRSLLEITRSINTPRDFDQLLALIVDSAINLTSAERGFLMLFRKDGNLEFKVTRNIDKKTMEGEEFRISRSVVNKVLANGLPLFLSDIYQDKEFKTSESIEVLGLRMVMCVPLKIESRLLGLIYVDSRSVTKTFSQVEQRIFEAFAAQASVAIENSYLYERSVHDDLTGLYNYGYLRSRLEEEVQRSLRYKKENISFMMIDLDDFKALNDSYGHLFGNSILAKVGEIIKGLARKCDIQIRYGGDEFAILMPETDARGAQQLGQRLQREIADWRFTVGRKDISITVSIGISAFPLEKIVDSERILVEADHALFVAKSRGKNQITVFGLRKDESKHIPAFIGDSAVIKEVRDTIARFVYTDAAILIVGETGTGKELITNLIHSQSPRADKPLVVVNCGAIPDNLIESELFGYEKGAFTGAYAQHKGKFELAQGGTIFLDEIGELPLHLQVKILRALEQKEIDRLGGKSPIRVDIRVIAATNKNLEEEISKGRFRRDLYYRLSVAQLYLPSLKDRPEDIEPLGRYYLEQMNRRYRRNFLGFTKDAIEAMRIHPWPGNVRELIHRIERAVIMGTEQYLDAYNIGLKPGIKKSRKLRELRNELEKETVIQVLAQNDWRIVQSAKDLGISRQSLRDLIKKHNISKPG
jgi:diguanylate cyclase (GGDEF)-like protein